MNVSQHRSWFSLLWPCLYICAFVNTSYNKQSLPVSFCPRSPSTRGTRRLRVGCWEPFSSATCAHRSRGATWPVTMGGASSWVWGCWARPSSPCSPLWPPSWGHTGCLHCERWRASERYERVEEEVAGDVKMNFSVSLAACLTACLRVSSPGCDVPGHDGDVGSVGSSSGALSPDDPVGIWGQLWGLFGSAAHRLHLPNLRLARCLLLLWWGRETHTSTITYSYTSCQRCQGVLNLIYVINMQEMRCN